MSEDSPTFHINDFVWAKIMGYSYWPAMIVELDPQAPPKPPGPARWVYFFGSRNFAWVREKYIKPYNDKYKKEFLYKCSQNLRQAYNELRWNRRQMVKDPNFKIEIARFIAKEHRSRPRSVRSRRSSSVRSVSSSASKTAKHEHNRDRESEREIFVRENIERSMSPPNEEVKITENLVGVFACNMYANAFTKYLIGFGHNVIVFSPSEALCRELKQLASNMDTYFKQYKNFRDLVKRASIIFSCFTSGNEAMAVLHELGADDKRDNLLRGKIYVEMSSINFGTSYIIANYLNKKNTVYIEAMIQGTRKDSEKREIFVLVGGRSAASRVLKEYKSCFWALGRSIYGVGEIGTATTVHAIVQMVKAVGLAGFSEALALADKLIDPNTFMDIFQETDIYSPYFSRVCDIIRKKEYFNIQETVQALQQDLTDFLINSNRVRQPVPMASTANQLFKHARRLGFDDRDSACMFLRAK